MELKKLAVNHLEDHKKKRTMKTLDFALWYQENKISK